MSVESELSPEMMAALSEQELALMKEEIASVQNPLAETYIITAAEHMATRASTIPGHAFHLNMPLAILAPGQNLEQINEARRKLNQKFREAEQEAREAGKKLPGHIIILGQGDGNYNAQIKLHDLTPGDLDDSHPRLTFDILSLRTFDKGEEVMVEDIEERVRVFLENKRNEKIRQLSEVGPLNGHFTEDEPSN